MDGFQGRFGRNRDVVSKKLDKGLNKLYMASMIRKHQPVSEEQMGWISPKDTICETLRGIYNLSEDPDIKLKCREATAMAKAMTAKLTEYKRNWESGFWDLNKDFRGKQRKPIDVLFLCWDDNANTGYKFWQCAKYLGLNSVMFKGKLHSFGYPVQAPVHPSLTNRPLSMAPITIMAPGLETLIENSSVVHLIASTYPMVAVDWRKVCVVAQHGGSVYRQYPEMCNDLFNQIASKTVIQCPDLLGLGAKNESWIYYPVDTHYIQPVGRKNKKLKVGHFPSNPQVKGTDTVRSVVQDLKQKYDFEYKEGGLISWPENLKRISECDIIVEGCAPEQNGKVYGEWGNTALEAAALGCAVVTHCRSKNLYEKEFGELGPEIANNPKELYEKLSLVIKEPKPVQDRCARWVAKHSIEATANRLWDLVYKEYL